MIQLKGLTRRQVGVSFTSWERGDHGATKEWRAKDFETSVGYVTGNANHMLGCMKRDPSSVPLLLNQYTTLVHYVSWQ